MILLQRPDDDCTCPTPDKADGGFDDVRQGASILTTKGGMVLLQMTSTIIFISTLIIINKAPGMVAKR